MSIKDTAAGQGGVGVKQLGRDVKSPRVVTIMFVLRCDYRQPGEHNWKKAERKGMRICFKIKMCGLCGTCTGCIYIYFM